MNRSFSHALSVALPFAVSLVAGCYDPASAYHDDILPTQDKLEVNLPVDSTTAKDNGSSTDWAQDYVVTRNVTQDVNGIITAILGTVALVVGTQTPSWTDDTKTEAMWGPYQKSGLDPVSTGIWVQAQDDGSYTWSVFYVPNGGSVDTDAVGIVAGQVDAGSTRDDASGQFAVDFTTAHGMDPGNNLTGTWGVQYAYDASGVGAVVAATDYGFAGGSLVNAAYAYNEDYQGAGDMDLAWLADIDGRGQDELATMRSRWQADGQGRGDVQVTGGDIGTTVVSASECWGTSFTRVYYTDTANIEPTEGSESDCAYTPAEYATEGSFAIAQ